MKIDGRQIAAKIYEDLKNRVGELKKIGTTPHLTVILVGNNPPSVAYVNQKQKWGEFIGAKITVLRYPESVNTQELEKKIRQFNSESATHAILIQLPLPKHIDTKKLQLLVTAQKDVDGFHPDSPFTMPLPLAAIKILEEIYQKSIPSLFKGRTERSEGARLLDKGEEGQGEGNNFTSWLKSQTIVILGKGATGGGPILKYLIKLGLNPTLIDSKTPNPDKLIKKADIVISAVGKPNIIAKEKLKKGVILIGVGIFRGKDGKLHGDYEEKNIKNIASFYTPTPGGVGPVNVSMLMTNLIDASKKHAENK